MGKQSRTLIEHSFPFDQLSAIAEQESWRKEVNRPASYIHKWWARRLGSVFRGLIIGCFEDADTDFFEKYYSNTSYEGKIVFDPFMGSGTTVHEAIRLGATAVGCDINPVAAAIVKAAAESYSREDVEKTYKTIENLCASKIKKFYKAFFNDEEVDVLYYFWVKVITCPDCGAEIPLTRSTVFSKNAYPAKKPQAKSSCPHCMHVNSILYSDTDTECENCHAHYNPQIGNIHGIEYICPICGKRERIVDYLRRSKSVPKEKMYAKMIVDSNGKKHYVDIDDYDLRLYHEAETSLSEYELYIPEEIIHEGINTNQVLNYQYTRWRDMFNSRQLLAFGILSRAIASIPDIKMRRLFAVLMSGTLEFNNMFCSFKGEGTGAVRPLFYNHILKPELMPLEANPWGCKSSSGSFSTLYETRIVRMLDYKERPFELDCSGKKGEKRYIGGSKKPLTIVETEEECSPGTAAILCKDSAHISFEDESIDLVVTDPPFFDNVNYSELADFFYVWLKKFNIRVGTDSADSTRVEGDVQDNQADRFAGKLQDVFSECHRVLKADGLMVFTYHHSRTEGWVAVYDAINGAGFSISQVVPIKAEMAVSVAIMAAKEPINYDLVFVCRKKPMFEQMRLSLETTASYQEGIAKIGSGGASFSRGDELVFQYGLALKQLSEEGREHITEKDIEDIVCSLSVKRE